VLQLFLDYVYACHVPVLRDMAMLAQLCYCAEKYSQRELMAELRHQVAELTRANRQLYADRLAEYGLTDHVIEHESIARTVQGLSEWYMSLEELLLAKSTMDFELHVTDDDRCESQSPREIFPVHRFVLANRSEFFAAAIRMALQRNSKSLMVEDISIRGARALMLYIYSDNVVLLNSIEICLEVLHFAAFSAMTAEPRHTHLIDHCRSLVIESLTIDNCLEVYEVALTVGDPDLATAILTWIAQYSQAILTKSKEEGTKLRPEILRVLSPPKPIVESQ
jgi:metal-responsive CopG/Arc/MetJ family transcriptional regulator